MATRKINTFIQHLMENYEQGPEDPMTGRPTMTYAGKHDDLDHSELTQMQSDHKAEIEPFFKSPDDFKSFDAHVDKGIRAGHDSEDIVGSHPVADHRDFYRNDHHFEGYIDATRALYNKKTT